MFFKFLNFIFSIEKKYYLNRIILTVLGIKISIKHRFIKLGAAYMLFDGEELLEASVNSIRDAVDYICVVYQKKSYYNREANPEIETLLNQLKEKGLIDEIYLYDRDFTKNPVKKTYEKEKRNICLKLCQKAGMTHYINLDVDEFYDKNQLISAKKFIFENKIDASACTIYEYLKSPEFRIIDDFTFAPVNPYNFYQPFIMKIHKFKKQPSDGYFPTYTDETRILNGNDKFYLFPVQTVVMHHMCTIRKDLNKKYENSTYNDNKESVKMVEQIKNDVMSWEPEQNRLNNSDCYIFNNKIVKKVEDKFGIKEYLK